MVMEHNSGYRFGECAGVNSVLPVSAFSAYSLFRNCNYLITSQSQGLYRHELTHVHLKPPRMIPPDFQLRPPTTDSSENSIINYPTKTFLTPPSTFFGYPHHIHILPNEQLRVKRSRSQKNKKTTSTSNEGEETTKLRKKSRDARKMREDQVALRATILEHENAILRAQVLTLREETSSLRQMLLQKRAMELATRDSQIRIS
ncbi:hypothetical protein NQ317_014297 [Molorchus minor]|uniref:BZIP domain-containing protein n=1 Tax=Molorchus minor TaxID=1323400 RepID=A0ABQ9K089_9CUCU|nr:hypothetical protein NQ317_014297 [Molorchus minor]